MTQPTRHFVPVALAFVALLTFGCARGSTRAPIGAPLAAAGLPATRLDGTATNIGSDRSLLGTVVYFVMSDCPVSNHYAPEMQRIADTYSRERIAFMVAYVDDVDAAEVRAHAGDFQFTMPALSDRDLSLARAFDIRIAPTVVVIDRNGRLIYRGRIDNRYIDVGQRMTIPTQLDLRNAVAAALDDRFPKVTETEPIGCPIYFPPAHGERVP